MKTLYLLRHAHALDSAPAALGDYGRVLSPGGEAQAAAVGDFMREERLFPGFVLSSPAARTLQTVRIVFGRLMTDEGRKVRSHFDRALYLAPAEVLLRNIALADERADSLLVAGHNPGIAELAHALAGAELSDHITDFSPATLAVFSADVDNWQDVAARRLKLEKVFVP
jgi:phosphohistidine phosphatase